jgi:hypothetical protein
LSKKHTRRFADTSKLQHILWRWSSRFRFGGCSQFALQLLNGRQAPFQLFGKAFSQPVFGDADGLVDVPERVFGDEPFPGSAQDDADAGLVNWMAQEVV